MTYKECLIVSAYTGILMTDFADFHRFVEEKMGEPVFTHEMGCAEFGDKLREKVRDDFLKLCEEAEATKEGGKE